MNTKQVVVCLGLIIKDKEVLLVQRKEEECVDAHLKWEIPGGKIETGETPEEATVREIREETGIEVKINKLIPQILTVNWEYSWGIQQTFLICYQCDFIKQHAIVKDHHVNTIQWIPLDDISPLSCLPGTKKFINLAFASQLANSSPRQL